MKRKDSPAWSWKRKRAGTGGEHGASARVSEVRGDLLSEALRNVALRTENALPPEGFEARLLAEAGRRKLLWGAGTAPASGARGRSDLRAKSFPALRWAWASAACAAIALVFLAGMPERPLPPARPAPKPAAAMIEKQAPLNPAQEEAAVETATVHGSGTSQPDGGIPAARPAKRPMRGAAMAAVEPGTDEAGDARYSEFVPLEFGSVFPAGEALQTVRVKIDADDFLRWGLPGSAIGRATQLAHKGRVTADFLVGDDGNPRAIRLVSMDQ